MAVPKENAPEYYWLQPANELRDLSEEESQMFGDLGNLLYCEDFQLLKVSDFCALPEPGNPSLLTQADFQDGTYLSKYWQAARQAAYYRLCTDE